MQKRIIKKERGQSMVELALALPLIILLLMGLIDFGRAFYIVVALNDAASEGAVYAGHRPEAVAAIQERAAAASNEALVAIEVGDVTVETPDGVFAGNPVVVTVEHEFEFITPLIGDMFGGSITLRGRATHAIIGGQEAP